MKLEILKKKRQKIRTEIAFLRGDECYGGASHDAQLLELRKELHTLEGEIADCLANQ